MTALGRTTSRSALRPGDRLGPYEILAPLGAGGMGEVYRARDERLGREVAVKVLHAESSANPDRLRRFEQEAKAAGGLNHPNLLAVFDTGLHEGAPYIVFELLEGSTLRQVLDTGALPPRKARDLAQQIAHGLAAAHEKGIVHRDLKPENLFLTNDGRMKILDFGLVKLRPALDPRAAREESTTVSAATGAGVVLGTVGYMSPEQVRGEATDHRSDIFSFGSVLYEMLSGRRAFSGETSPEVMTAILREDPPEWGNSAIPPGLEGVVRRCLEKRPEERFQSARDVAFALEAGKDAGPTKPTGLPWPGSLAAAVARRTLMASGAVAGLLAASLLAWWWLPPQTTPQIARSTQLTFAGGVGAPEASLEWLPAIFTDGARIYFTDYSRRPGLGPAYVSREGGAVVQVPSPVERGQVLSLSPDGGRLLVRHWLSPVQMEGALWVVPTSGSAPKRLGDIMAHDAAWSRDGQSLVYARGEELYLSSGDGGQARRLATTPGRAHWIRWSPDGRHLRFTLIDTKGNGVLSGKSPPMEPTFTPCPSSGMTNNHRNAAVSGPGTEGTSSSPPCMSKGRLSGWSTKRGPSSAAGAGSRGG